MLTSRVIEIKFRQFAERARKPGIIQVRRGWQDFALTMDMLQSFLRAEWNGTASADVQERLGTTSPVKAWIPQENREEP